MDRIEFYLRQRAGEELAIGAIVFSLEEGILGRTKKAEMLLQRIRGEKAESAEKHERAKRADGQKKVTCTDKQEKAACADEQGDQEKKTGGTDQK